MARRSVLGAAARSAGRAALAGSRSGLAAALAGAATLALLAAPRALPAVERLAPKQLAVNTTMEPRHTVFLYLPGAPPAGAPPAATSAGTPSAATTGGTPAPPTSRGTPIIFYSGDWGWRPLQQDTASHLAAEGRPVLGLDATVYFKKLTDAESLKADLETFRAFVNEKSGRPKDGQVILAGFGYGAEMIPYLLNRTGANGVLGVLLIAPDKDGAAVFRVAVQLKMAVPEEEAFDVAEEVRRMPSLPAVLMQGAQDAAAQATALHAQVRGPRRLLIVPGADHQFKAVRETYLEQVSAALRWIESGPVK
jgi:type IV secretory pathway VirJ component